MAMDLDGAWRAVFAESLSGAGVVILRSGKLLGCDSQFFYEGDYATLDDGRLTAEIHVKYYAGEGRSIFYGGEQVSPVDFYADLEGKIDGTTLLQFSGTIRNTAAAYQLSATLTRLNLHDPKGFSTTGLTG
jgi:hypothetical protein